MENNFVSCEIALNPDTGIWEYWEGEQLRDTCSNLDTLVSRWPNVPVDTTGIKSV